MMLTIKRLTTREGTVYRFKQPVAVEASLVAGELEIRLLQPDGRPSHIYGIDETQKEALFDLAKCFELATWPAWLLENVQVGA
jgi:hypothetical protein